MAAAVEDGIGLGGNAQPAEAGRRVVHAAHLHRADVVESAVVIDVEHQAEGRGALRFGDGLDLWPERAPLSGYPRYVTERVGLDEAKDLEAGRRDDAGRRQPPDRRGFDRQWLDQVAGVRRSAAAISLLTEIVGSLW